MFGYFYSDKMVLHMYRARIVKEHEAPRLYKIVKRVSKKANIPMPRVAIIPEANPNAFATGRNPNHAVVAATEGILDLLDDDELEGVIAHEVGHVKNRDILVMSVAATIAGAISFAANFALWGSMFSDRDSNPILLLIIAITAPIAAMLIQMAISRSREYEADRRGALLIGKPLALATALERLERGSRMYPLERGNPATSSLFIVNPFRGGALVTLFSTHPPIRERVRRLRKMKI
jgi:heat shock protein HtpX